MREIKFRAWDKDSNKMIFQYDTNGVLETNDYYFSLNEDDIVLLYYDKDYCDYLVCNAKLMQYIGMKDRYGKEIYEGDILSIDGYSYEEPEFSLYGEVKYGNCGFCIDDKFDYNEPVSLSEIRGSYTTIYEVVGNIFENPELLKDFTE